MRFSDPETLLNRNGSGEVLAMRDECCGTDRASATWESKWKPSLGFVQDDGELR
jgi:hypothetical protein